MTLTTFNPHPALLGDRDERSRVPVGAALSMYDPIPMGMDEFRKRVDVTIPGRNMLTAGLPDSGKSCFQQNIVAYALLCDRARLVLIDGKMVEFGLYTPALTQRDVFVGPSIDKILKVLTWLQAVIDHRANYLFAARRRKFTRDDPIDILLVAIDELAYFTTATGTPQQRAEVIEKIRDVISRGRFVGVNVIAATQRPSADIIPKSLRDVFAYRAAFRCMSSGSSDIILGDGLAHEGYDAATIPLHRPGVCYLLAENGIRPGLVKGAYLSDDQIKHIVDFAAWTRSTGRTDPAGHAQAAAHLRNVARNAA
jgi:S-DNA-T family DNA segregation ATPase FtsK/SpoIIIE